MAQKKSRRKHFIGIRVMDQHVHRVHHLQIACAHFLGNNPAGQLMLLCRSAVVCSQGSVCTALSTFKAPLAPLATQFVLARSPRSTSYTARRAHTAVVRAMESGKICTALEETSNDGAFKVGTL